jgi:hypothetical protein
MKFFAFALEILYNYRGDEKFFIVVAKSSMDSNLIIIICVDSIESITQHLKSLGLDNLDPEIVQKLMTHKPTIKQSGKYLAWTSLLPTEYYREGNNKYNSALILYELICMINRRIMLQKVCVTNFIGSVPESATKFNIVLHYEVFIAITLV